MKCKVDKIIIWDSIIKLSLNDLEKIGVDRKMLRIYQKYEFLVIEFNFNAKITKEQYEKAEDIFDRAERLSENKDVNGLLEFLYINKTG